MIREAKAFVVECDHPDCAAEFFGDADVDAETVREYAKETWYTGSQGDFCPDHIHYNPADGAGGTT